MRGWQRWGGRQRSRWQADRRERGWILRAMVLARTIVVVVGLARLFNRLEVARLLEEPLKPVNHRLAAARLPALDNRPPGELLEWREPRLLSDERP